LDSALEAGVHSHRMEAVMCTSRRSGTALAKSSR
jgi:hypothetical protein